MGFPDKTPYVSMASYHSIIETHSLSLHWCIFIVVIIPLCLERGHTCVGASPMKPLLTVFPVGTLPLPLENLCSGWSTSHGPSFIVDGTPSTQCARVER